LPVAARSVALLILLAAPLSVAPATAGQADRESALRWYDGVDTDHNEMVDAAEMNRVRDKRFRRYDGNGDGYITLDEFNYSIPEDLGDERERRSRRFAVMDRDGDSRLIKEEYLEFGGRVIQAADRNGDGIVTRQEFADTVAPQ
jgi:Ca2+-binding EF-hand superfamily protein